MWVNIDEAMDDVAVLQALVAKNGHGWIVEQLDAPKLQEKLWETWPYTVGYDLPGHLTALEDSHYPPAIIALLRDNQHTPWLTPNPSPG